MTRTRDPEKHYFETESIEHTKNHKSVSFTVKNEGNRDANAKPQRKNDIGLVWTRRRKMNKKLTCFPIALCFTISAATFMGMSCTADQEEALNIDELDSGLMNCKTENVIKGWVTGLIGEATGGFLASPIIDLFWDPVCGEEDLLEAMMEELRAYVGEQITLAEACKNEIAVNDIKNAFDTFMMDLNPVSATSLSDRKNRFDILNRSMERARNHILTLRSSDNLSNIVGYGSIMLGIYRHMYNHFPLNASDQNAYLNELRKNLAAFTNAYDDAINDVIKKRMGEVVWQRYGTDRYKVFINGGEVERYTSCENLCDKYIQYYKRSTDVFKMYSCPGTWWHSSAMGADYIDGCDNHVTPEVKKYILKSNRNWHYAQLEKTGKIHPYENIVNDWYKLLPEFGNSARTVYGPWSQDVDDASSKAMCASNEQLVGCSYHSISYSDIDNQVYVDGVIPDFNRKTCTAYNSTNGQSQVMAVARCVTPKPDGGYAMGYRVQSGVSALPDQISEVKSNNYRLIDCTCYSPWRGCELTMNFTVETSQQTCSSGNHRNISSNWVQVYGLYQEKVKDLPPPTTQTQIGIGSTCLGFSENIVIMKTACEGNISKLWRVREDQIETNIDDVDKIRCLEFDVRSGAIRLNYCSKNSNQKWYVNGNSLKTGIAPNIATDAESQYFGKCLTKNETSVLGFSLQECSGSNSNQRVIDFCPNDPTKIEPGQCGCGIPETDSDRDGLANCHDECPLDPNKTEPGLAGCGKTDFATIRNESDGANKCLIFGSNGKDTNPQRHIWNNDPSLRAYCGLPNKQFLLDNKQAVWKFTSLGNNKYTISNASDGNDACLLFSNNGLSGYPQRYMWSSDPRLKENCGLPSKQILLDNKQAVWTLHHIEGDKYTVTNESDGSEKCLIFGNNGLDAYPQRYMWSSNPYLSEYCGLPSKQFLLDNKQAVWIISKI